MFEAILKRIREKIRKNDYVVTLHARREMIQDHLTLFDLESAVLTGKILERQQDRVTLERKYRIRGRAINGATIEAIVKLSPTGKLVIITVYCL